MVVRYEHVLKLQCFPEIFESASPLGTNTRGSNKYLWLFSLTLGRKVHVLNQPIGYRYKPDRAGVAT